MGFRCSVSKRKSGGGAGGGIIGVGGGIRRFVWEGMGSSRLRLEEVFEHTWGNLNSVNWSVRNIKRDIYCNISSYIIPIFANYK